MFYLKNYMCAIFLYYILRHHRNKEKAKPMRSRELFKVELTWYNEETFCYGIYYEKSYLAEAIFCLMQCFYPLLRAVSTKKAIKFKIYRQPEYSIKIFLLLCI